MRDIFTIGLLQNTLRTATPVVLAALGIMLTDHVGIMNIGMDGMMLCGAFFAVLGSCFLGSWVAGLGAALACGLILGLFFGLFVIRFKSDEFIIGVALNIFAGGLTVFLLRTIFGVAGPGPEALPIHALPRIDIPLIGDIPVLGQLLSGNTLLVYVSWLLVAVLYALAFHTPLGFDAARRASRSPAGGGVSPEAMKLASILCGLLSGLAGAHSPWAI